MAWQRLLAPDPALGPGRAGARGDDRSARVEELGVEVGPPVVLEAEAGESEDALGGALDDHGGADGDGEVARCHGEVAGPRPVVSHGALDPRVGGEGRLARRPFGPGGTKP